MAILQGITDFSLWTIGTDTPITQSAAISPGFNEFTIEKAGESSPVQAFVVGSTTGELATIETLLATTEWTMTIQVVQMDWFILQLLMNEFESTTSNYVYQKVKTGTLASGTQLLADADLVGLTAADVRVSVATKGAWGDPRPLKVITTGTPAAGEILLDATGGDLTGATGTDGMAINYWVNKTISSAKTIGVAASPKIFGNLSFVGALKLTGDGSTASIGIKIPQMASNGSLTLATTGEAGTTELVYTPTVASGKRLPVEFFRVS